MSESFNHTGAVAFVYQPHVPGSERKATESHSFVIENSDAAKRLFREFVSLHPDYEYEGDEAKNKIDRKSWTIGEFDALHDEEFQKDYAPQIGELETHEAVRVDYRTGQKYDSTQELEYVNLQQEIDRLSFIAQSEAHSLAS